MKMKNKKHSTVPKAKKNDEPESDWNKNIEEYHKDRTGGVWIHNVVPPGEEPMEYVPPGTSKWKKIFGK